LFLYLGQGTHTHLDQSDLGLSLVFYLGFHWGVSPYYKATAGDPVFLDNQTVFPELQDNNGVGFGIPELKCIWQHGPGSVVAVRAFQYHHGSILPTNPNAFRIMGASFIHNKTSTDYKTAQKKKTKKRKRK
jgi:hypothetical protein